MIIAIVIFAFAQATVGGIQYVMNTGHQAQNDWNRFSRASSEILSNPQVIAKQVGDWNTSRSTAFASMNDFLANDFFASNNELFADNIQYLQQQLATIEDRSRAAESALDAYQSAIEADRDIGGGLSYKLGYYQGRGETSHPVFVSGRSLERGLLNIAPVMINFEGTLSILFSDLEQYSETTELNLLRFVMVLLGFIALAGVIIAVLLSFSILRSLRRLQTGVQQAANLDLSVHIDGGNDELGKLAVQLNSLFSRFRDIIADLQGFARDSRNSEQLLHRDIETVTSLLQVNREHMHNLEFSSLSLRKQVEHMRGMSKSISGSIGVISDHTEDQSAAAEESSAAIEQMEASLRRIADIVGEREAELQELLSSTRQSQETGRLATETITSVASDIDRLNEILTVIATVASQTNLLSMNAAIESAHAGDAGRGFSVVAEEIRKLAETTSNRSKEIKQNLKAIIQKIQSAQSASQENYQYLEHSGERLQAFASAMREVRQSTTEVSTGSKEVLNAANELSDSVNRSRQSAGEILSSAKDIEKTSADVDEFSGKLAGRVEDMLNHSGSILEAVESVARLQASSSSSIAKLEQRVEEFTIEGEATTQSEEISAE